MRTSKFSLITSFLFALVILKGQETSEWHTKADVSLSGYLDLYYLYDFNEPLGPKRQPFLFNHNRHNAISLNLGLIKVGLNHTKYRSNLALHSGTYVQDNYASEPEVLKFIAEANVGVSLNRSNTCWVDAGIFPSHIGFESVIAMDNATMTRSLLAENSPYFMTGAKITYSLTDSWKLIGWVGNGWQRIQREAGSSLPAFGTQVVYSAKQTTFNWSTFAGTVDPDISRRWRFFNNFYSNLSLTKSASLTLGLDVGFQQRNTQSAQYDSWISPVLIGSFAINDVWKTAIRFEYYSDKTNIIIPILQQEGFRVLGCSWNWDYTPVPSVIWRSEIRGLRSPYNVFESKSRLVPYSFFLGTSLAIRFDHKI
jgi:hypothetical protein